MLIGLVRNERPGIPLTSRLPEALASQGDTVDAVLASDLSAVCKDNTVVVRKAGGEMFAPDVVVSRILSDQTSRRVLYALEASGVPVVNPPFAMLKAGDKQLAGMRLGQAGVGTVPTMLLLPAFNWVNQVAAEFSFPLIVKPVLGEKGKGVEFVQSKEKLLELSKHQPADEAWLAQPWIPEAAAGDIRVFVVGDKAVAAMRRAPSPGDHRSNLAVGGKGTPHDLTSLESTTAVKAAKACSLLVAGVDLIPTAQGPLVLEVNPNPGLGIADITGIDVTRPIVSLLREVSGK